MERQEPIRISLDKHCDAELGTFPVSHRCGLKRGHAGPHFSGAASWVQMTDSSPDVAPATWWLSFADPNKPAGSQFLGVVLVEASSFEAAFMAVNLAGVNPGGEVRGQSAEGAPPDELARLAAAPKLTLLSFQQLTDLGFKLGRPSDVDNL